MTRDEVEMLGKGRFLQLLKRDGWEYVDRPNVDGLVALVPVSDAGEIVLVEQYRHPVRARVVEPPAGLAGDTPEAVGESLESAAAREFVEETGFRAERLDALAEGPPSGGQSTEIITFFLATGLERVHDGGGDATEDIQVHVVPMDAIDAFLTERAEDGALIDPKVYTALYFAQRHLQKAST